MNIISMKAAILLNCLTRPMKRKFLSPEPGVTTRWHRLSGISERYVILEGSGSVEVGDLPPKQVETGDMVTIPPMCRQRISNTGSQDLIFLAICSPRFLPEAYQDIEKNSA